MQIQYKLQNFLSIIPKRQQLFVYKEHKEKANTYTKQHGFIRYKESNKIIYILNIYWLNNWDTSNIILLIIIFQNYEYEFKYE